MGHPDEKQSDVRHFPAIPAGKLRRMWIHSRNVTTNRQMFPSFRLHRSRTHLPHYCVLHSTPARLSQKSCYRSCRMALLPERKQLEG